MPDLSIEFCGVKAPNPFWLASAPPTNSEYQVRRAFDAGWGGVVWKTLGHEPIVNVSSRYGGIEGTLKQISASTFEDGEGKPPYYKAIVTLSRAYVGSDRMQNQIMPGMAVQADIRTGTRSVLQYLIKPVNAALSSAFNER